MNGVNAGVESGHASYPASAKTNWRTVIDDATAAAASAPELLAPLTFAGVKIIPLGSRVSRLFVRAVLTDAVTAVATSPVVRLYAFSGDPDSPTTAKPIGRIDAATWNAAGLTLTANASPSASNMFTANGNRYTETLPSTATQIGYDCLGASFLVALTQTAAAITNGAISVEIGVLN